MPLTVLTFSRGASMSSSRRSFATSLDSITDVMRQGANEQMDRWMDHQRTTSQEGPITWPSRTVASKYVEEHIDAILLDCDGVLYRGLDVTPEARECLSRLMAKGKQLFFVTNNAGQNRLQLRDKLVQILDCSELKEEQMICSSYSCAQYLKEQLLEHGRRRVHVIGTQGLCDELTKTGFVVTGGPSEDVRCGMSRDELAATTFPSIPQTLWWLGWIPISTTENCASLTCYCNAIGMLCWWQQMKMPLTWLGPMHATCLEMELWSRRWSMPPNETPSMWASPARC